MQAKAAAALTALESDKIKDETTELKLLEAQKQHEAAEDTFKTYAPLWDEAADLDARIELANKECVQAEQYEHKALEDAHKEQRELERIETSIAELTAAHEAACRDLEAQSASSLIADRQEDIARLLDKRSQHYAQLLKTKAEAQSAKKNRQDLKNRHDELSLQRDGLQKERDEHDRALQQSQAALDALDAPSLEAKDAQLRRLLDCTREPLNQSDRFNRASETLARAMQDAHAAGKDGEAANANIAAAERALHEARTRLADLEPLHELAEGSISKEAVQLRSVLVEGKPCPVCGSAEHPKSSSLDQLQLLAQQLRQRRDSLKASIEHQNRSWSEACAALAKAQARKDEAFLTASAQKDEMLKAQKVYATSRAELEILLIHVPAAAPLPEVLDATTAPALQNLTGAAEDSKRAIAEQLKQISALRETIDRSQKEQQALARSFVELDGILAKIQSDLHQTDIASTNAETHASALANAIASTDKDLAPFLAAADLATTDLDENPGHVIEKLKSLAEAYGECRATTVRLEKERQTLEPKKAGAAATLQAAATRHSDAASRLKERKDIAADLKTERAKLLEGEDTNSHRTRINTARREALDRLNAMQEVRRTAASNYQAALTRKDEAVLACENARNDHTVASATYDAQCAATGETSEGIDALLAISVDDHARLKERLREIDAKLQAAAGAHLTRKADLERLESDTDQTVDPETLQATITARDADIAELNRKIGEITAILAGDDSARRDASELSAKIETARGEFSIAQAVHDAIGSATGDKFRRFVQAITLDHLIALANTHLHALNPRYRLIRSPQSNLSIHIVDRDMADEQRASRSLSGGERFLVSLALALALSGLEGRSSFVDTLFIDEGFGALDPDTLDIAIDALETLHGRGQKVGVITHVAAMIDRVQVQVRVEKKGGGQSVVRIVDASAAAWPLREMSA